MGGQQQRAVLYCSPGQGVIKLSFLFYLTLPVIYRRVTFPAFTHSCAALSASCGVSSSCPVPVARRPMWLNDKVT